MYIKNINNIRFLNQIKMNKPQSTVDNNKNSEPSNKKKIFLITKITKEHCLNSSLLQSFIMNSNDSDSTEFNFDGLINVLLSIKQSNTVSAFHTNFLEFKKALNFKKMLRKTKIDSILKKCKSKFFRAIQESIKKLTNESSQIGRLPQFFITNINIDYNKDFMNKTIGQIYIDLHVIQNLNDFYYGLTQEKAFTLQKMLNMTYTELFNSYITSQRFKEDCESIRMKEGEKFEILYKYVSKIYIKYYSLSKGNKPKRLDREEKLSKRKRKFFNVKKK